MAEAGASPAEIEAAAETARRDASGLTRLKHPAIVKVRFPCTSICMHPKAHDKRPPLKVLFCLALLALFWQPFASASPTCVPLKARVYTQSEKCNLFSRHQRQSAGPGHGCRCSLQEHLLQSCKSSLQNRSPILTLQVVESLEETRTQLLLVTEPIFASAADLLARFATLPPAAADARRDTRLSELEIKAGLLQVSGPKSLLS